MADAAAARREARRRRILDNSQNRLQFITGKSSTECIKESPSRNPIPSFPDLQNESPAISEQSSSLLLPTINNGILFSESESFDLPSHSQDFVAAGDRQITNNTTSFMPPPPEPIGSAILEKIIAYKYDIVILSLFIQLLYSLPIFTFDNSYFFLPLIIYVVTKTIWFPTQSKSGIANALMLLNGISAQRVQTILRVSNFIAVISQDVCVYLFTTICVQSIINTLKDNLGT